MRVKDSDFTATVTYQGRRLKRTGNCGNAGAWATYHLREELLRERKYICLRAVTAD